MATSSSNKNNPSAKASTAREASRAVAELETKFDIEELQAKNASLQARIKELEGDGNEHSHEGEDDEACERPDDVPMDEWAKKVLRSKQNY